MVACEARHAVCAACDLHCSAGTGMPRRFMLGGHEVVSAGLCKLQMPAPGPRPSSLADLISAGVMVAPVGCDSAVEVHVP